MAKSIVEDFMRSSSPFVYENDDLLKVIESMKTLDIDSISVLREDFSLVSQLTSENIRDYLKKNFFVFGSIMNSLKNIKVRNILNENTLPLVFYPGTKAEHAFSLMKYLNNKYAPVIETPFDRKVVGFIWLKDCYCS